MDRNTGQAPRPGAARWAPPLLLAALFLAALFLAAPCGAQTSTPIPPTFFGMSPIGEGNYPGVTIGTLGHPGFAWGAIEPSRGHFDFDHYDAWVAAAAEAGQIDTRTNTVELAMTLAAGTPAWAVADQSTCRTLGGAVVCTAPPDDIKDWKDFVRAVVQRYNGKDQPHIRYYELWNEANIQTWWTGTHAQLVALAQAAYPIVHEDPYSLLLTPSEAGPVGTGVARSGETWMAGYLSAGGYRYADGGAIHGYNGAPRQDPYPMPEDGAPAGCSPTACYSSIVTQATTLRAVFDANGMPGKPMFQTEGSWGNATVTDPDAQAAWLARWNLLQAGLRSTLNLQMTVWFCWSKAGFGWGSIQDESGGPTAAGVAYDEVYHWLVGATMSQPCSGTAGGVWTCSLTREGGYAAQAVWSAKGPATYKPGARYTQYRDLTGATIPIPASGAVPIGAKPVLVEGSAAAPAGAPSIVLVLTDDQDLLLGSMDYMPRVKALLADRGTTFRNAYVPLSLCCPSRTSILRGQFPHNTGVLKNGLPSGGFQRAYENNVEASTIATLLHGAGYRTCLLGKYLNGYPSMASATYVPPGWDEWYSPAVGNPYSEYHYTLNENGTYVAYKGDPEDYLTDVIAGKAADFIQRAASKPDQPLFIYFATYAPHAPYTPAPRHANLFPGVTAPKPASFNEADVSDKPAYIREKTPLEASDVADIDADYRMRLQALQAVDEAVASLISKLSATGRLTNTYVVFASDNGYHMGEHRLLEGKYTPYETDIRVPLIIRGPNVPAGVVRDELVASLDLAATFADLAGLAQPELFDGRSLKGFLGQDPPPSWRRTFLLEEFNGGKAVNPELVIDAFRLGLGRLDPASAIGALEPPDPDEVRAGQDPAIPTYTGIRAPGYKYVEYATGEKELYVASDPDEVTNVASKADPAVAAALSAHLRTLEGCVSEACRSADAAAAPSLLTASFTVTPAVPASGAAVTLAASAAGTAPYTYGWSVDAAAGSGASLVVHPSDGVHTVTLRARDAIGAEAVVTKSVTVGSAPVVQIQAPSADTSVEASISVSFRASGTPSTAGGTLSYVWSFGDGTPDETGATVDRPFGVPGTYTVTLTGTDSRGAVARATRTVVVRRPELTGASLLLPVVLETPGVGGSYYTSEVTIASHLDGPVEVLLTYTASVGGGSGYARIALAAGHQRIIPGIVDWLRGRSLAIPGGNATRVGTLEATFSGRSNTSGVFLGARTFTPDPAGGSGTFGLFYLAAPVATDTLTVFGLQQNASQRSNLALVNTSEAPVTLRTRLLGPDGHELATFDTGLAPHGWAQVNTPLAGTGAASGVAVVTLLSGTGTFSAYGVLNDAVTSDGSFIPPLPADASAPDRLVPIVLSVAGYSSELTLTNLTASPLTLALTYKASPQLGSGSGSWTASVTLAAGEQRIAPDALAFLRQTGIPVPATGDAGGSLDIRAAAGSASSFAAGARTFIGGSGGGTFGLFYIGLTLAESATSSAWIQGLQQNGAQRSNVAVVNRGDAGDTITLRVTYYGADGTQVGSPDTKSLAPGEWAQFNRPLESRGVSAGSAKVERVSGSSRFVAYGVLNDQTNSDGSYIPMTP